MRFLSRRLVMPNDLNYANSLFGGRALEWIDEEAAIWAICQLETNCRPSSFKKIVKCHYFCYFYFLYEAVYWYCTYFTK